MSAVYLAAAAVVFLSFTLAVLPGRLRGEKAPTKNEQTILLEALESFLRSEDREARSHPDLLIDARDLAEGVQTEIWVQEDATC